MEVRENDNMGLVGKEEPAPVGTHDDDDTGNIADKYPDSYYSEYNDVDDEFVGYNPKIRIHRT